MKLLELMQQRKLTKYRLAKMSNVPYTTISDLARNNTNIYECSVATIYKIATTLNVSIESLLEDEEPDFELFKSEICHDVKRKKDLKFIADVLKNKIILKYYRRSQYKEALYLLAMVDYLSRINHIPLCKDYDKLRNFRLSEIIYPRSLLINYKVTKDKTILDEARENAIPEFIRFNIVENKIRNVA